MVYRVSHAVQGGMAEFKVEFSDANVGEQYEHSAVDISKLVDSSDQHPGVFLGDRESVSMIQLHHRKIVKVINAFKDNHALSKEKGVEYLNIDPVETGGRQQMADAMTFISRAIADNESVLISCQTGGAQSAAIGLYWLMKVKGLSFDEAYGGMQSLRPVKLRPELMVMVDSPRLLERDDSSLTVVWKSIKKGATYELQLEIEPGNWKTLSSTLTANFARKKNLKGGSDYRFRYRFLKDDFQSEWSMASARMTCLPSEVKQMSAVVVSSVTSESATLQWLGDVADATGYLLRYRQATEDQWTLVEKQLSGSSVKKRNLEKGKTYYFAVRPVIPHEDTEGEGSYDWSVSLSSSAQVPSTDTTALTPFLAQLFPSTLKSKLPDTGLGGSKVTAKGALAGKIVAVYFSAAWCGPCRRFTPMLAEAYNQARARGMPFEVVFCSADHSEEEFEAYYGGHHPWLSIDYEVPEREALMGKFSVKGIPQLSILGTDGRYIEPNAVQSGISLQRIESWCARMSK